MKLSKARKNELRTTLLKLIKDSLANSSQLKALLLKNLVNRFAMDTQPLMNLL
jgi:hypothetical protein